MDIPTQVSGRTVTKRGVDLQPSTHHGYCCGDPARQRVARVSDGSLQPAVAGERATFGFEVAEEWNEARRCN